MVPRSTVLLEVLVMSQLRFRMDDKDKKDFEIMLLPFRVNAWGSISNFRKKSIEVGGLPFEVSQPTRRLEKTMKSQDYVEFNDSEKRVGLVK